MQSGPDTVESCQASNAAGLARAALGADEVHFTVTSHMFLDVISALARLTHGWTNAG